MVNKVNFNIDQFELGNDGAKWIEFEIMCGARPAQWNNPQHPDNAAWKARIAERMAAVWDGRSPSFGFARIIAPNGQIDMQNMGTGTKAGTPTIPAYTQAAPQFNQAPVAPPMYMNASAPAFGAPAPQFNGTPGFGQVAPQFNQAAPGPRKLF
jgi:hypothetical protein